MKQVPLLKITFDWRKADAMARGDCRGLGRHDLPKEGREGQEKPGSYTCARCGVVKIVKEALR